MLDRIIAPVQQQIEQFEQRLSEVLISDVTTVQGMSDHLLKYRGKRFRPALALLTARALGQCSDKVIEAAVAIEIIQTATLVHDDVLDLADKRRGADVLHQIWGNRIAVLMGDFMLAKALQVLVGIGSLEVMQATTRATQFIIEGEILETENEGSAEAAAYFAMISKKTASLTALACEVGAILGNGSPEQINRMVRFGTEFGVAFQITDDLLDFIGDEQALGKPVGTDVREKKLTLPLIRAMDNCKNGEARDIQSKVLNGVETDEDWQEIIHFVHRYQGIEAAREEAQSYAQSALKNLDALRTSEAREALSLAVQHVIERDR
jgi:octaprenyl-diphosphate synthase